MRTIWFSIDNMFKIEVDDDATDDEVTEKMYERMGEILSMYCAADFDFLIEEEE